MRADWANIGTDLAGERVLDRVGAVRCRSQHFRIIGLSFNTPAVRCVKHALCAPNANAAWLTRGAAVRAGPRAEARGIPRAESMTVELPVLTGFSAANDGSFPMLDVIQTIDGRQGTRGTDTRCRSGAAASPKPPSTWGRMAPNPSFAGVSCRSRMRSSRSGSDDAPDPAAGSGPFPSRENGAAMMRRAVIPPCCPGSRPPAAAASVRPREPAARRRADRRAARRGR